MRAIPSPAVAPGTGDSASPRNGALTTEYSSGNRVLDALPPLDRARIERDLVIVTLSAHQFTHTAGGTMHHVDFPIDAVLSVVATLANGDSVEVGTVGCESFVEADAALESSISSRTSFCQVKGRVGRMSVERFDERMTASAPFARLMRHNVRATLFSAQQFAACNAKHSVLQRCARWLCMTADRVGSSQFTLTHDFLSIMLGVRRAGVSEAADALSRRGAIEYARGVVTVLDKHVLEGAACECYDACRQAFVTSLTA
jgi:CRP-like cAMP-binding protein